MLGLGRPDRMGIGELGRREQTGGVARGGGGHGRCLRRVSRPPGRRAQGASVLPREQGDGRAVAFVGR